MLCPVVGFTPPPGVFDKLSSYAILVVLAQLTPGDLMKTLLPILFCLIMATSAAAETGESICYCDHQTSFAFAATGRRPTDADIIQPLQPLPSYTQKFTDEEFQHWARQHNEFSYRRAAARSYQQAQRNRGFRMEVTTETYRDYGVTQGPYYGQQFNTGPSSNGEFQMMTRTYRHHRSGGGMISIINPYVRRP